MPYPPTTLHADRKWWSWCFSRHLRCNVVFLLPSGFTTYTDSQQIILETEWKLDSTASIIVDQQIELIIRIACVINRKHMACMLSVSCHPCKSMVISLHNHFEWPNTRQYITLDKEVTSTWWVSWHGEGGRATVVKPRVRTGEGQFISRTSPQSSTTNPSTVVAKP